MAQKSLTLSRVFQPLKKYLLISVFLGCLGEKQARASIQSDRPYFQTCNEEIFLRLRSHLGLLEWKALSLTSKNLASQIQQAETVLRGDQGYQSFKIDEPLQQGLKRLHKEILQATQAERDVYTPAKQALQDRANEASFRNDLAALSSPVQSLFDNVLKNLMPPHQLINSRPEWRERVLAAASLTPSSQQLKVFQTRLHKLQALKPYLPSKEAALLKRVEEAYEDFIETICTLPSIEDRKDFLEPRAYLQIESHHSYLFPASLAQALQSKDRYGASTRYLNNQEGGNNNVFAKGGVHFKAPTSIEGIKSSSEWMAHSLSVLLLGHGWTPPSATLCLRKVPFKGFKDDISKMALEEKQYRGLFNQKVLQGSSAPSWTSESFFEENPEAMSYLQDFKKDSYLQASETSGEISLLQFFEQIQKGDSCLTDLDEEAYSGMVLLGFLLGFADAKDDNYRLQGNRLISIDNEDILAPFIVQESHRHYIQAKNTLFLLAELMAKPVHPTIVARIKQLDAPSLILKWLYFCHQQNQHYEQAFKSLKLPLEEMPTVIRFGPETALTLKRNLEKVQTFLYQQSHCSHQQLFETLCPEAALFYQRLATRYPQEPQKAQQVLWGSGQAVESLSLEDLLTEPEHQERLSSFTEKPGDYQYRDRETNRPYPPLSPEQAAESFLRRLELQDLLQNSCKPLLTFLSTQPFPAVFYPAKNLPETLKKEELFVKALAEGCDPFVIDDLLSLGHTAENFDPHLMRNGFHAAVLGKVPLSVLEKLVQTVFPSQGPELLNAKDKKNLTPLDLSMDGSTLNIPAFKYLMNLEAFHCNDQIALKFYKKHICIETVDEDLKKSFQKLMRFNPAVDWQISLAELLPAKDEPGVMWTEQDLEVISSTYGLRVLPQRYKEQLFTPQGQFILTPFQGNHPVVYAKKKGALQDHGLYFKFYPALPGLEEASSRLIRDLLGFGAPYTDLIKIEGHLALISQEITGDTLHTVLKYYPHRLQNLDSEDVIGLILASMLINPEDGKPDNYIVTPHPFKEGSYRLVGVDNDQAFVPAFVREKPLTTLLSNQPAPVAQVKTILYCMDQMKQPIPALLRTRFITLQPDHFLESWLNQLKLVSQRQEGIFTSPHEAWHYFTQYKSFIGIPFQKGMIKHLYEKLNYLRNILITDPSVTPLMILCKLEPRLGRRYQAVLEQSLSPLERFKIVDQPFYTLEKKDNFTTMTQSADILQSMQIPVKQEVVDLIYQRKQLGPAQASTELEEIRKEGQLSIASENLLQFVNPSFLKTLTLERSRVGFQKALLQQKQKLSETDQVTFVTFLSQQKDVRELILVNFNALTDTLFNRLPFEHLQRLDLRNCIRLTNDVLVILSTKALALEDLNLAGLIQLKSLTKNMLGKPLSFKSLHTLNLRGCTSLTSLSLQAPSLKWLSLKDCQKIKEQSLKILNFPALTSLNIEGCSHLTDQTLEAFLAHTPNFPSIQFKGCPLLSDPVFKKSFPFLPSAFLLAVKNIDPSAKQTIEQILRTSSDTLKLTQFGEYDQNGALLLVQAFTFKPYLTHLVLNDCHLGDEEAQVLAKIPSLIKFDLRWNSIQDLGVQAFFYNNNLTYLDLSCNQVTGVGAQILLDHPQLTYLDISWNLIRDLESQTLENYGQLRILNLEGNFLPEKLKKSLLPNSSSVTPLTISPIVHLSLESHEITEEDFRAANDNQPQAQQKLREFYLQKKGLFHHEGEAFTRIKQRAVQGEAIAEIILGWMYYEGYGVEEDEQKALSYLEKYAQKNFVNAQSLLGFIYTDPSKSEEVRKKGTQLIISAAQQGYAPAQYNYYRMLHLGFEQTINNKEALQWLRRSALQGYARAQCDLGQFYSQGIEVKKDDKEAGKWLTHAAAQSDFLGQYLLGLRYAEGKGAEKDYCLAFTNFKQAADQKYAPAQFETGKAYFIGNGVEKNLSEAVQYLKLSSEKKYPPSQYLLGLLYQSGEGLEKDEKEAFDLFKQAADQGHAVAQLEVGRAYDLGKGVEKNLPEAVKYLKLAVEEEYPPAYYWLGLLYENGQGVEKDEKEAFRLVKLAADQNHTYAQYQLALKYEKGHGIIPKDEKLAFKYFKLAAKNGHILAQFEVGQAYYTGQIIDQNFNKAIKYLKLAVEEDYSPAQYLLGILCYNGEGIQKNEKEALKLFQLAADQGHAIAQFEMGRAYIVGDQIEENIPEAVKYLKLAIEEDYPPAKYLLGVLYDKGEGVEKNETEAFRLVKLAADQDHAQAQYYLALKYENGNGDIPKDEKLCFKYLKLAAKNGHTEAQFEVGRAYYLGQIIDQDLAKAFENLKLSAEKKYPPAQYLLGVLYDNGEGVKKDEMEAVKYFKLAADQNHIEAQFEVGRAYILGKGLARNLLEAVKYLKLAAEQDYPPAQYLLGFLYESGEGVKKDETEALRLYQLAAEQGHALAQKIMKEKT